MGDYSMDIINSFHNHLSLKFASYVQEICSPLKKYDIDFFIYSKTFTNQKRLFLTTNAAWTEHYICNVYNLKYVQAYIFDQAVKNNHLISFELFPNNLAFRTAKEQFGLQYGLLMPFLNKSDRETCYFVTTKPNPNICNFFLQNTDTLKMFKIYFTERVTDLIKKLEKDKLPSLNSHIISNYDLAKINSLPLPTEVRQQLLSEIKTKRYYLLNDSEGRYLTRAEYHCAVGLLKGKSAEEISRLNGVSRRTVENYIANMKYKFKCNKISMLVYILVKLGLTI